MTATQRHATLLSSVRFDYVGLDARGRLRGGDERVNGGGGGIGGSGRKGKIRKKRQSKIWNTDGGIIVSKKTKKTREREGGCKKKKKQKQKQIG